MIREMLEERKLPPLKSREEMLNILLEQEYGYLPPKPEKLTWTEGEDVYKSFCAGNATLKKVILTAQWADKEFSFPIYVTLPTQKENVPFFININFTPAVPDRYQPTEELVDNGYAVLSFGYKDVTSDDDDMTNGLAGVLYENGVRGPSDPGKIAMWAWAAQRIMDYAQTLDCLDHSRGIVCGHSRLGKTALLTAATDERFYCAHSNDSGCSGAALSRGKNGESVKRICERFPYWFCENYVKASTEPVENLPFDQHYLVACIAPRKVHIASADLDNWADPISEYLTCTAASPAFGENAFVGLDRHPVAGDKFHEGTIGYCMRKGRHYFSRNDWLDLIDYLK